MQILILVTKIHKARCKKASRLLSKLESYMATHVRSSMSDILQILPFWDWSKLYSQECLLENPLYDDEVNENDCQEACGSLKEIDRLRNTSAEFIAEAYVKKNIPVTVLDGMSDWPKDKKNLDIKTIYQLFLEHPVLSNFSVCGMTGVVNTKLNYKEDDILRQAVEENLQDFYMHWDNCEKVAGKVMRSFSFSRPYFLPHLIEIISSNMLFVSQGYKGRVALDLPANPPKLLLLVQYKGQTGIKIMPSAACKAVCAIAKTVLNQGNMLLVPAADIFYDVKYLPHGPETVMMGFVGEYD